MFLGEETLRLYLKKNRIIVEEGFDGSFNGMTIDVRLGHSILVPELKGPLDPLAGQDEQLVWREVKLPPALPQYKGQGWHLKPNTLALGFTHERIAIDRETVALINSRSTAARFGLVTHHTAPLINPGHGYGCDDCPHPRSITLELSTSLPEGMLLYDGLIIASLKFAAVTEASQKGYDGRQNGNYCTDHGNMRPNLAALLPDPQAREGLLARLLGLQQ
jgi:deoxycytidine triphosphate deaminase